MKTGHSASLRRPFALWTTVLKVTEIYRQLRRLLAAWNTSGWPTTREIE
jgi:hypothetical protein